MAKMGAIKTMKLVTEIAVIGAGPSGICAAVTAARLGRKVILVGDRPVIGGNSSSEVRVWTRGATGAGNLYAEETGVWGDFKLRNLFLNCEGNPVLWDDVLLEQVLACESLTLLLNTHITDLHLDTKQNVSSVSGFQLGTENFYEISADYFIDCTGDGTLGALAHVPFTVGREAKTDYQESLAPEKADRQTLGNSILFFSKKLEKPVEYHAPSFVYDLTYIENLINRGGRVVNETMNGSDCWWFEYGGAINTITDAQDIAFELKKLALGVWNYIKNSGKFEAEFLTLEWIGNLPGKRESRRMITDYVLTQNDIVNRANFDDASFYGGWYLDFHPSDGIYTEEEFCSQIPVNVYPVPLRCLYNSSVHNLLFAGRDIGTTHAAFASTRIMNTCALSGQAAATLASACLQYRSSPAGLSRAQINQIRQKLLRMDMFLPGFSSEDEDDIAKKANVEVSSVFGGGLETAVGYFSLERGGYLVIPSGLEKLDLRVDSRKITFLEYTAYVSQLPSSLLAGCEKAGGVERISVKQGEQWISLSYPEQKQPCFYLLVFQPNPELKIATAEEQLTGILGGHSDQAEHWYPCFRADTKDVYGAENLTNGYSRPWCRPNVWISSQDDIRPEFTLSWEREQTVGTVELTFNPDLSLELNSSRAASWSKHHKFAPRTNMPPQLVKSFQILGKPNNSTEFKLLAERTENWRRKISVKLPEPVQIQELKVVILSTYGAKRSEVFEIRVYKS